MGHWSLDDIRWDRFDRAKVDPDVLSVVRAAALVERNAGDYSAYLGNVFADDPALLVAVEQWAREEVQHGDALGRWAEMADPGFDYEDSFRRFVAGYRIPLDVTESVRGSRTGELIARCVVETGTSSFYSALRDASEEPVLKEICHRIAGDEFRHYKLFYTFLQRYRDSERPMLARRVVVTLGRLLETQDDELPMAYHCGNTPDHAYDRRRAADAYAGRAFRCYAPGHVGRAAGMMMKAAGLNP